MIMFVSVMCLGGYLVKIYNDRDNFGWKEENKQIYFFLSYICNMNVFVDIKYMYLYILLLINFLNC